MASVGIGSKAQFQRVVSALLLVARFRSQVVGKPLRTHQLFFGKRFRDFVALISRLVMTIFGSSIKPCISVDIVYCGSVTE